MQIAFLVMLFVIGACLGSFLCCQARRLHLKVIQSKTKPGARSICLNCYRKLKWYDNIPIVSWFMLRGKCRYCHHEIGFAEILSELGLGLSFLSLGTTFNFAATSFLAWAGFIMLLFFTTIIGFLAIYDGLYGELPIYFIILALVIATISLIIQEVSLLLVQPFSIVHVIDPLLSVLILGGLYFFLFIISKGKWVGDGDWLLGVAIALVLFRPLLALINLFLANILACIVMIPFIKKRRNHQIYFGPFLAIAFVITYSVSNYLYFIIN